MSEQYQELAIADRTKAEAQSEEQALRVIAAQCAASIIHDTVGDFLTSAKTVFDWLQSGDNPD